MSTVRRALVCAVPAVLLALACGPAAGAAMAEPPTLTIESPVSGSFSTSQTPSFGGVSNDSSDDVTLNIYAGAKVEAGALAQTLTTLSPPLGGVWLLEPVADLPYGVYTAQATQTNSLPETGTSEPPVTFTIAAAPVVTSEPADRTVLAGKGAAFVAVASGYPAPEVQWQVSTDGGLTWANDTTDAGNATGTLTIASTTVAETGNEYRAVFTNEAGMAASSAATLTVNVAPVVTSDPASQGVKVGETATFTVVASGTPAPEVQWQESKDFGLTWTDDTTDSGNTTGTLTVLPATVAESGNEYRAVFTNVAGAATSEPATLTVFEKPVVPVALVVTSNPVDQAVLAGEGAVFTATASGVPAPEVRWQVSMDSGSTWANDTTDAGNTTGTLAVLHATVAESGNEYRAVFTNVADTVTSKAATLTVDSPPPSTPPAPVITPALSTTTTSATSPLSPTPSVAPPPTPPTASFTWAPSDPAAGQNVVLASTSTDLDSPIAAFAWGLAGNGAFTAGGPVISTSFAAPGDHVVRLRVTDDDGLASVATETIPVAATPLVLMQPFPVVRIAGSESSSGARISLLTVQAPVGTQVEVMCRGHHCPSRSLSRVVVATSRGADKAGMVVLTFGRFERSLQAGVVLEIRVSKPGEIGKYTSFAIRSGRLPVRVDACVEPADPKPIPCPAS
jgi:hypothetical protein